MKDGKAERRESPTLQQKLRPFLEHGPLRNHAADPERFRRLFARGVRAPLKLDRIHARVA